MALADKEHTRMFSTTGSDADKIDSEKLTKLETAFTSNEYLVSEGQTDILAPVLWQMQKMQNELDELRRHLENDVVGQTGAAGADGADGARGADGITPTITDLDGSSLPTSSSRLATGKLWNDRGTVKVA